MENKILDELDGEGKAVQDQYGIVAFSHLRWGFVWQRPQQFLSRFAKESPVLFIEEPVHDVPEGGDSRIELHDVGGGVTVAVPHVAKDARWEDLHDDFRRLTQQAVEFSNRHGHFSQPLHWFYSPMMAEWALDVLPAHGVVYDCMDELSQFRGAPASLIQNENLLIESADIVFTGGYELFEKKSRQHENAHCFGCGVEYAHFSKAQDADGRIPEDIAKIKKPIVGWFGVIDERVDYDLIRKAADMRPDYSFVMVGPVVKVDENDLPKADNIHWLGGKDYKELPDYCRAFDVCMMCFALNEATEYINPTKALEYLATGKPVISTPVRDVVRQYQDTVVIAASPEEFVKAIDEALESPDEDRIQRGIERAQEASWERTVETMRELIQQAIADREEAVFRKMAASLI